MKKTLFILLGGGAVLFVIILSLVNRPVLHEKVSEKKIPQEITVVKKSALKTAPDFSLKDVNGQERKLSEFKDKVVIIDFWATWCPPCREEIPHFIDLYSQYKDQGLEIIGIALDGNAERVVPRFVTENNINYTILLGNQDAGDLYGGIAAIPTTFIVDKEGKIRKKYIGYNEKEVFERDIKELL